jgi:BASS family bile acid:Na+ symporter
MHIRLNRFLEQWMPAITPFSVIIGIVLSSWLIPYTGLVPWIFALLTFSGSLSLNLRDLHLVAKKPLPIFLTLLMLHLVMPLIAWGVGKLFFADDMLLLTGIILLFLIPTGVISFMWVSIYKGSIALTLTIILISTLISPFSVPFSLYLLVGAEVSMDSIAMMKGLLVMIVIPSIIGILLNQFTAGKVKERWSPVLAPYSKIGLGIVIAINSANVAPFILKMDPSLFYALIIIICLVSSGYVLGHLLAKWSRFGLDIDIALTFNSGMRNVSAGAVIAITYFPAKVAYPVVVGMLFQQILASLFGRFLFGRR